MAVSRSDIKQARAECTAAVKAAKESMEATFNKINQDTKFLIIWGEVRLNDYARELEALKAKIKKTKAQLKETKQGKACRIKAARAKFAEKRAEAKRTLELTISGEIELVSIPEVVLDTEVKPEEIPVEVTEQEQTAYDENIVEVELIHKPFKTKNGRIVPFEGFDHNKAYLCKYKPEHRVVVEMQGMACHDYDCELGSIEMKRRAVTAYRQVLSYESLEICGEYADQLSELRQFEEPNTEYQLRDGTTILRKDMSPGQYKLKNKEVIQVRNNYTRIFKLYQSGCKNKE